MGTNSPNERNANLGQETPGGFPKHEDTGDRGNVTDPAAVALSKDHGLFPYDGAVAVVLR